MIDAASPISVKHPERITGKRALVIEDGPTLTHGEMKFGAGIVAAHKYGAREIVDPRPYTTGTITDTFRKYPGIGTLLPAMGYGEEQVKDLQTTINKVPCDVVIIGTPIDLNRIVKIRKPTVRVTYELQEDRPARSEGAPGHVRRRAPHPFFFSNSFMNSTRASIPFSGNAL